MYTKADIYQQYKDEIENIEHDYSLGEMSEKEYNRQYSNLNSWLEDELKEYENMIDKTY